MGEKEEEKIKTPVIELAQISRIYNPENNPVNALSEISMKIFPGEMVAIVGPSGCGKSTLMNILGCMDKATSGEYYLDGVSIQSLNRNQLAEIRNSKIGFIFQSFNLLPKLTAIQNVELPLLYSHEHSKLDIQAELSLKKVGLFHRASHLPSELSGGEKQRIAIARALITSPAIILADEPTGNLDTKTGEEILSIFHKLHRLGITIIMVTHDLDIAEQCSRQIRFRDGKIISDSGSA
jgi:putative ABC transport system ATP-binding protein